MLMLMLVLMPLRLLPRLRLLLRPLTRSRPNHATLRGLPHIAAITARANSSVLALPPRSRVRTWPAP